MAEPEITPAAPLASDIAPAARKVGVQPNECSMAVSGRVATRLPTEPRVPVTATTTG